MRFPKIYENYLLQEIFEIYETLSDAQWFTSVDASQVYHQIPLVTEMDRDLTSFVTSDGGLYRYKYMPFGLKNIGAGWSRFIDGSLAEVRWNVWLAYTDECLIQPVITTHTWDGTTYGNNGQQESAEGRCIICDPHTNVSRKGTTIGAWTSSGAL